MLTDSGAVVCVDSACMGTFRCLVREELRLGCTYLAEAERDGADLVEDRLSARFQHLALFARLSAEAEQEINTFALATGEVPAFRLFLRDVLFTEQECQATAEESGDVLTVVAATERVELVDCLADQLGGLF